MHVKVTEQSLVIVTFKGLNFVPSKYEVIGPITSPVRLIARDLHICFPQYSSHTDIRVLALTSDAISRWD